MKHFPPPPAALVCLDLQRHQADTPHAAAIAARCARALAAARRGRWPVLHVHGRLRGADCRPLPGLEPRPSEPIFLREGPSAFSNPGFVQAANRLGGPLALIGFSLQDTVTATAFAALDRKFPVEIVSEAVAVGPDLPPTARTTLEILLTGNAPAARIATLADLFLEEAERSAAANLA